MCRLFPCIPIFRGGGGGLLKGVKKLCLSGGVENCIVNCEKCIY